MRKLSIVLLIIVTLQTISCGNALRPVTSYMNCHQQWHLEKMLDGQTICQNGSLVTCLAMIIQYSGLPLNNKAVNPRQLNKYLLANNGYPTDGRAIDFSVIGNLGLQLVETVSKPQKMRDYFDQGYNVIINYNYGSNYLVLLGYTIDVNQQITNVVNNPQDQTSRTYKDSDINVAMIFKVNKK